MKRWVLVRHGHQLQSPYVTPYLPPGSMNRASVALLVTLRFDDFRHRHAEFVLDDDDFTARDETIVDVDAGTQISDPLLRDS